MLTKSQRLQWVRGAAFTLGALTAMSWGLAPAAADWLVIREGGRVATKGPWRTKGNLIIFTRADDDLLVSLRLGDVDLPASRQATAAAQAPSQPSVARPVPVPPKKSVRVLTDADFVRKEPPAASPATVPAAPATGGEEKGTELETAAAPAKRPAKTAAAGVVVSSWRQVDRAEGDGIQILGTLQNNSADEVATDPAVTIRLFNEAGENLATVEGVTAATAIRPQGAVQFHAVLPRIFTFAEAKFEVTSHWLKIGAGPVTAGKAQEGGR
jgi:hypothetical protein